MRYSVSTISIIADIGEISKSNKREKGEIFMENENEITQEVRFRYEVLDERLKEMGITRADLAARLGIEKTSVDKHFTGERTPSAEHIMQISSITGLSMDYLCGIDMENIYEQKWLKQTGMTAEVANAIQEYLSRETKKYLFQNAKEGKKNSYKRLVTSFFDTKVQGEFEERTFIEVFAENVLNLLIFAKWKDTSFMQLFVDNVYNLSLNVNNYKTVTISSKENLDFEFEDILNNNKEIKHLYGDVKETLQKAIDDLIKFTLEEEFNNAKPKTKLV